MRRQIYFPGRIGEQPNWLLNLANKLTIYGPSLSIPNPELNACMDDAKWCAYLLGLWLEAVRAFSPATTDKVNEALMGTGNTVITLPTFTAPALPAGASPQNPGVLARIFAMVARIKKDPAYDEAMGTDLGIVGAEETVHAVPKFTTSVQRIGAMEVVRLGFYKYAHDGVYMESRRNGGAWEMLGIDTESPYTDERPLLNPAAPEVREYRMCFWDKGTPNGDWTDVAKVTVSP